MQLLFLFNSLPSMPFYEGTVTYPRTRFRNNSSFTLEKKHALPYEKYTYQFYDCEKNI